jgi:hypothetical protein
MNSAATARRKSGAIAAVDREYRTHEQVACQSHPQAALLDADLHAPRFLGAATGQRRFGLAELDAVVRDVHRDQAGSNGPGTVYRGRVISCRLPPPVTGLR